MLPGNINQSSVMNITLRQRLKAGKISLYLDYYQNGKRQYEYLKLYLIPEPEKGKLSKEDKEENRRTSALAESIKSKRHVEMQNGAYGFQDLSKIKGSFASYVKVLSERRRSSKGNYDNWDSALKHLRKFDKSDSMFSQIDRRWLESFKHYLEKEARTPADKPLSPNSQHSYYNKIRAALREAHKEGIIQKNPAFETEGIKPGDTEREFLTYDELQAMVKANCEIEILKKAFLFSALTGLRWSDIQKLVWSEVQQSKESGYYLRFKQKKTKGSETLPISTQAFNLLGDRETPDKRVFHALKYSSWHNIKLQQWAMRAGISKTITFHCARHTYATLQLTFGTDIYTVSKLLGHKDLKTTQIYAKIIDERKRESVDKIVLNFD
jgi:integrase